MNDTASAKVLIVEDEQALVELVAEKLVLEGFNVIRAANGEEGLEIALKEHPHIILLDLLMPKMGGIDMLRKLRQDKWGAKVPVIVLSNVSDSRHIFESIDKGVLDYLVKSNTKINDVVKHIRARLKIN